MRTVLPGLPGIALSLGVVSGCSTQPPPLTPERVVPYAQPAVVHIQAFGDIEVTAPSGASTKKQYEWSPFPTRPLGLGLRAGGAYGLIAPRSRSHLGNALGLYTPSWQTPSLSRPPAPSLVANEYTRDRCAGVVEESKSQAEYCWEKVAEAPEKYLKASAAETRRLENVPYAHGSGFAVSREGIILTNAHVVADPEAIPPSLELLSDPINKTIQALISEFGSEPPDALKRKLVLSLAGWFAPQTAIKGKFEEARIVLNQKKEGLGFLLARSPLLDALLGRKTETPAIRDISVPAEVKTIGEPFPGKDVAVLKVAMTDRLICMELGDSDAVTVGTTVHAMGYPGAALLKGAMEEKAAYRVIAHDGIVDQRMPMVRGWEGFHMTADINPGDSGGPVIDKAGKVIGLNVAGNPEAPAQNVAVPINIAKEFLTQSGVQVDPGPASEHWLRGQREFGRQNYAAAKKEFEKVARLQNGADDSVQLIAFGSRTNEYVDDMIDQCRKLGNLPPEKAELPRHKTSGPSDGLWESVRRTVTQHPLLAVLLVVGFVWVLARR